MMLCCNNIITYHHLLLLHTQNTHILMSYGSTAFAGAWTECKPSLVPRDKPP